MSDRRQHQGQQRRDQGGPQTHHSQRRDGGERGGFHGGGRGRGRGGGSGIEGPLIYLPNRPLAVAPRLTDGSQDALINRFKEQGSKQVEMPTRPGWGTLGLPIHLRSNFFGIKLPKGPFYDYSVTITDVTPKTADNGGKGGKGRGKPRSGDDPTNIKAPIKRRIFELLEEDKMFEPYKSFVVHDYSQRIVAAKKLPQPLKLTITFREEDEKEPDDKKRDLYEVSVEFLDEIKLEPINRYLLSISLATVILTNLCPFLQIYRGRLAIPRICVTTNPFGIESYPSISSKSHRHALGKERQQWCYQILLRPRAD